MLFNPDIIQTFSEKRSSQALFFIFIPNIIHQDIYQDLRFSLLSGLALPVYLVQTSSFFPKESTKTLKSALI